MSKRRHSNKRWVPPTPLKHIRQDHPPDRIGTWQPTPELLSEIQDRLPDFDVEAHLKRFLRKYRFVNDETRENWDRTFWRSCSSVSGTKRYQHEQSAASAMRPSAQRARRRMDAYLASNPEPIRSKPRS